MPPPSHRRRPTPPRWPVLLALLALLLAAAACSGGDSDDSATDPGASAGGSGEAAPGTATAAEAPAEATEGGSEAAGGEVTRGASEEAGAPDVGGGGGDGAVDPVTGVLQTATHGRSVIYTADVEVEVADVTEASRLAQSAIAGLGGLLFGQETTTEPATRSLLTFKVPPAAFAEALARLDGLGTLQSQRVGADDVTERVVDLQSRITTAEVSVARLRELLDRAGTLEQVAALEGQLLARETELEQLRGQLRTVQDAVDLATINLLLHEAVEQPALEAQLTAYAGEDDAGSRCPGDDELTLDEGEALTLCVAVTNTGDTSLTAVEVRDPGLGLRPEDFTVLGADPSGSLAPGDQLLAWARVEADPGERPSPQVSAVPVDDAGEPLRVRVDASTAQLVELEVLEDDSLPGFTDALSASWGALARLGGLLVLAAGAVLPFVWVVPAVVLALRWHRRRRPQPTTA